MVQILVTSFNSKGVIGIGTLTGKTFFYKLNPVHYIFLSYAEEPELNKFSGLSVL